MFDKHIGGSWTSPLRGRDSDCAEVQAYHAAIQPQEIDVTGRPQPVVTAYQAYRLALDNYNLKVSGVANMCADRDYELNPNPMAYIRTDLKSIIDSLKDVQDSLGQ